MQISSGQIEDFILMIISCIKLKRSLCQAMKLSSVLKSTISGPKPSGKTCETDH